MSTIVRERIEMRVDVETKQFLQEQANIKLSNAQFDRFIEVCNAEYTFPTRLKYAAQLLDNEGF